MGETGRPGSHGRSLARGDRPALLVALLIGVLVSMFTAVFVTRVLMRLVFQRRGADKTLADKSWALGV